MDSTQLGVGRWAFATAEPVQGGGGGLDVRRFFCFYAAFARDPKKTERMMFGRPGLSWLANDLVDEPTPPMPAIAHSSRNSAQPGFKCNTQRIREENRDIERHLLPQLPNN